MLSTKNCDNLTLEVNDFANSLYTFSSTTSLFVNLAAKFYRLNHQIQAPTVRLLADDGSQIGILPIAEARAKAAATKQDLVEISGNATPPVIKLIDFKKFRYQEAKKDREASKNIKKVDLKELRLTPFMGESDLKMRLERAREFLGDGHKVKLVVRFTGRQMAHPEFGHQLINNVFSQLSDVATVDQSPRMIGRQIISVITPLKK